MIPKWSGLPVSLASMVSYVQGEFTVPSGTEFDPSCHFKMLDSSFDSDQEPTSVQIRIKKSKTDPFWMGHSITIGQTKDELCPIAALISYHATRSRNSGAIFHFKDDSPLTGKSSCGTCTEAFQRQKLTTQNTTDTASELGCQRWQQHVALKTP